MSIEPPPSYSHGFGHAPPPLSRDSQRSKLHRAVPCPLCDVDLGYLQCVLEHQTLGVLEPLKTSLSQASP